MDFLFLATGVPNIFVFQKRKFSAKMRTHITCGRGWGSGWEKRWSVFLMGVWLRVWWWKKLGTRGGVQNHANKQKNKNDFHNSDRKKIQPGTNTSFWEKMFIRQVLIFGALDKSKFKIWNVLVRIHFASICNKNQNLALVSQLLHYCFIY